MSALGPGPGMASLAGLLQQQGPGQGQADQGLGALQQVIDLMPRVLHELTDATDVHDAATCLRVLTGIQKRLMGAPGGAPTQGA